MKEERGIHIHSRLLNKVARGVNLPVNHSGHKAAIHWGEKPFDDGSGPAEEGYAHGLSQTSFSIPGEATRYKKDWTDVGLSGADVGLSGADEGLSEEAFPAQEIKKPFEGPQISEPPGAPPSHPASGSADFRVTGSSIQQKDRGIPSPPVSHEDTLVKGDKKPPKITEITAKQGIIRDITGERPHRPKEPPFDERDSHPFNESDFQPKKRMIEPSVLKPLFFTDESVSSQTEEPGAKDLLPKKPVPDIQKGGHPMNPPIKGDLSENAQDASKTKNMNQAEGLEKKITLQREIIIRGDKSIPGPQYAQKERAQEKDHMDYIKDYTKDIKRPPAEQAKPDTIGHSIQENNIIRGPEFKKDILDEKEKPVTKRVQGPRQGSIKIGRINITVQGRQKAEEESWPEAPEYNDHMITEDWEWSCLYGRQG